MAAPLMLWHWGERPFEQDIIILRNIRGKTLPNAGTVPAINLELFCITIGTLKVVLWSKLNSHESFHYYYSVGPNHLQTRLLWRSSAGTTISNYLEVALLSCVGGECAALFWIAIP
jgi:hypothetical protein